MFKKKQFKEGDGVTRKIVLGDVMFTKGKVYDVKKVDKYGNPSVINDYGDLWWCCKDLMKLAKKGEEKMCEKAEAKEALKKLFEILPTQCVDDGRSVIRDCDECPLDSPNGTLCFSILYRKLNNFIDWHFETPKKTLSIPDQMLNMKDIIDSQRQVICDMNKTIDKHIGDAYVHKF